MYTDTNDFWQVLNTGFDNPYGPHNADARAFGNSPKVLGLTYFFRYSGQEETIQHLASRVKGDLRILVVPGSVGCEAYTLAMIADKHGAYQNGRNIEIHSLELVDDFTRAARYGRYPKGTLPLSRVADYAGYFNDAASFRPLTAEEFGDTNHILVRKDMTQRVKFITGDMLAYQPDQAYDAVFCMNLLGYFKGFQDRYLDKLRDLSRGLIIANNLDRLPHMAEAHPFKGMHLLNADWQPIPEQSLRNKGLQSHFPSDWFDCDEPGSPLRHNLVYALR